MEIRTQKHSLFKKGEPIRLLIAALIAFSLVSVCSKNSFLYPMNDWVDANCFLTMGRAVLDGKVLYRDIYEQKGPLLYFVYALAAFISRTSFIGAYLIEIVCFTLFLYYSLKCTELYTGMLSNIGAALVMMAIAASITTSLAFVHGGSVEEFSLFTLTYTLYHVLRNIKTGEPIGLVRYFMFGVFAAAALWSKFTICGFFIGICLYILVTYLKDGEKRKKLFPAASSFIVGAIAATLPIIIYFACNDALDSLFISYFYNNIFVYPTTAGTNIIMKLLGSVKNILLGLIISLGMNELCSVLLIIGAIYLYKNRRERPQETVAVLVSFASLFIFTFIGGRGYTAYYGLVLCAFAAIGAAGAICMLKADVKLKDWLNWERLTLKSVLILICAFVLSFVGSGNTYLLKYKKEDLPQYQFAAIINEKPDPSLLNYGFLDGGFYYAAQVEPECKYFCKLNINLAEMIEEQNSLIENGQVDFVVTRSKRLEEYDLDSSGYYLVTKTNFTFEMKNYTYYLYEKIDSSSR